MKNFLKKQWSNILFGVFIILLIIPQTRMPIQVFVQRLISFSPSETSEEKRETLSDYNWPLVGLNSEEIDFSQSEGKVVVLNFWATWCPPCVAEMPSFQKLYDDYASKVDFYFVTTEKPDKVTRFLKKHNYSLPAYLQHFESPDQLQSSVLPTTYVLSKTGEIVVNESGVADWNSKKIRNLLDKLLSE
ncbi:TlpA family protein disulfide reductase [Aequorivita ciconiae]|uniref:TlpA family protein disulfide reductase n=1 Tax=Aequorivita ciconiae TaxID=2494375 RepID=UPI001F0C8CF0|nr:TlpA disulfide reductase family protein [Aequorivita sp. H23M31]